MLLIIIIINIIGGFKVLDIKFIRENPEIVKENIRKKFKEAKLPLVDKAIELEQANRRFNGSG